MFDQSVVGRALFEFGVEAAVDRLLAEVGASACWAEVSAVRATRWDSLAKDVNDECVSTAPEFSNDIWCRRVLSAAWPRPALTATVAGCSRPVG